MRTLSGDKFEINLHKTSKDQPPQVGVVLVYTGDDAETARSIAQHISFANPTYLSRDDVPADEVEKEREIVTEISRNEGNPEAALPKIVEGRMNGFYKSVVLEEQGFARDPKVTVGEIAKQAGGKITAVRAGELEVETAAGVKVRVIRSTVTGLVNRTQPVAANS